MKKTLLIMAAGLGSRYGGNKQIDGVGPHNEILLEYAVHDALAAGFDKFVFVIKDEMVDFMNNLLANRLREKAEVHFACQNFSNLPGGFVPPEGRTKPYGTVHAILAAKDVINEPFAVINADDYYGQSAFKAMADYLEVLDQTPNQAAMVAYYLKNTVSENGHVTRGVCTTNEEKKLQTIVETYQIQPFADGTIRDTMSDPAGIILDPEALVSMNFWGFRQDLFVNAEKRLIDFLNKKAENELKKEYVLPTLVDQMMHEDGLSVHVLSTDAVWFGMTYIEDKPTVAAELKRLHDNGSYPEKLF